MRSFVLIVTLFSLLFGSVRNDDAQEALNSFTVVGFLPGISYVEQLNDLRSSEFIVAQQRLEQVVRQKIGYNAAKVSVAKFRQENNVNSGRGNGVVFYASLFVDKAIFETNQKVLEKLKPTKRDQFKIFQLSVGDEPLRDFDLAAQGWDMSLIEEEKRKYDEKDSLCANGGAELANGSCYCMPYFTGKLCQSRICLNAGFSTAMYPRCACPPGYPGLHCEPLPCSPMTQATLDFSKRTLFFVISARDSMALDINGIIPAALNITTSFQMNHPGFFDSFVSVATVSYDNHQDTFSSVKVATSASDFINDLSTIIPTSGDNYQPILTAISKAFSTSPLIRARSPIYIFADSMASDIELELQVIQQALSWNAKLFFILTNIVDSDVYPSMNVSDPGYQVYQRLAVATGGELILLSAKSSVERLLELFTMYQYDTETILDAHRFPCNFHDQEQITVDKGLSQYYLHTVSSSLVVVNNATSVTIPANYVVGTWSLYIIPATVGVLDFYNTGQGDCSYRAFIPSNEGALLGFTTVPAIDSYAALTSAEIPHSLVARVTTNSPINDISIEFKYEDATSSIAFIPGTPLGSRDHLSCVFPLIFNPWQNCTVGPYSVDLFILLQDGSAVGRSYPAYCLPPQYAAQPTGGPPSCQNGGTINPLDGSCQCPALFGGSHCEITGCVNGATQIQYPEQGQLPCTCLPGYTGVHCETLFCATNVSLNLGAKKFAIVLEQSMGMSTIISEVGKAIRYTMPLFESNHPGYFSSYVLTTFYNRTVGSQSTNEIKSTTYSDAMSFADGLHIGGAFTTAIVHPSMAATYATLLMVSQGTPIFIYATRSPSDMQNYHKVLTTAIQMQTPLYFVLTSPFPDVDNNPCIDPSSTGYQIYNQLAIATGGLLINFCGLDRKHPVQNFTSVFASMQYNLEAVSLVDQTNCSNGFQETFAAESNTVQFYFVLSAVNNNNPMLIIRDKNDALTTLSPYQNFSANVYIYQMANMPAGIYSLWLNNTLNACSLRIYEMSSSTVVYGFSPDPSVDMQTPIAHIGKQVHPVVHGLVSAPHPHPVLTVAIYDMDMNQLYMSASQYRSIGCNYESYLVGAFACTAPFDFFYVKFIIQDALTQLSSQRTRTGYCMEMSVPKTCLNDGVYNEVVQRCQCHAYWDGNYCEVPHCFNGGTVDSQSMGCICLPGYSGFNCEFGACSSFNFIAASQPPAFYFRSIAFVVQSTIENVLVRQTLAENIQLFLAQLVANGESEQQLTLVTFDRSSVTNVISTADAKKFQAVFSYTMHPTSKELEEYSEMEASGKLLTDPAMSFEAIDQAVELTLVTPSIIYVITDVPPIYSSVDQVRHVYSHLIASGNSMQINLITTPISPPLQPKPGNGTDAMNQLISFTNGRIIYTGIFNVGTLMKNYLTKTVSENGLVSEYGFDDCTRPIVEYFPMETRAKWFTVTVQGLNAQVALSDAAGNSVSINATTDVLLADGGGIIVYLPQSNRYAYRGIWSISASTTRGGCRVQVRVASSLQINIGYVLDEASDYPISTPFAGQNATNRAVVKLTTATVQSNVTLQYFKAYGIVGNKPVLDTTAKMNLRDSSCAYQWYSDVFKSPSLGFGGEILGSDENGYPFKRIQANYFMPPECQNGGNLTAFSKCVCPVLWTGFDCRYPICLNGGTLDLTVCNCQYGYYGLHCENALTLPTTTGTSTTGTTGVSSPSTSSASTGSTASSSSPGSTVSGISTQSTPTATATSSVPTTTPTCDMSTLQWDIVFLFDVSFFAMSSNMKSLNLFKNVSLALSGSFTLGLAGGQFAPEEYANNPGIYSNFLSYQTHSSLNEFINHGIGYFGSEGGININLGTALQAVNDNLINGQNTGLRQGVRHMVIFAAVLPPDDEEHALAVTIGQQLRSECVYVAGLVGHQVDLADVTGSTDFITKLSTAADVAPAISWLNQKVCTLPACPTM